MTVRNLALNGSRRRRLEARIFDTQSDTQVIDIAADMPDPEATAISRDEYARIMAALKKMPENMRIAVEMHRIAGKKPKEIAAFLGVSTTTDHTLVVEGIERCQIGRAHV